MVKRVFLICWNAAEGKERAGRLREAGFETSFKADFSGADLRAIRVAPPDAFVIDLNQAPSHGLAVATALRRQKATRSTPIVFAGGAPDKAARVKKLLPDASYSQWSRIAGAVRSAMKRAPADPVIPGTMAAYSGTPLAKKLAIRTGSTVALLGAPADFTSKLEPLPEGVWITERAHGSPGIILLFVRSLAGLKRRFAGAAGKLAERGGLWIVWPKKASGVRTDLSQGAVRSVGLGAGWSSCPLGWLHSRAKHGTASG